MFYIFSKEMEKCALNLMRPFLYSVFILKGKYIRWGAMQSFENTT